MPFDPRDFFTIAQTVVNDYPDSEAALRTAVGRAYYSTFLQAREELGVAGRRRDIHGWVRGQLSRTGNKAAASQLSRLEELRNIADYSLSPVLSDSNWARNWEDARRLASHVQGILSRRRH